MSKVRWRGRRQKNWRIQALSRPRKIPLPTPVNSKEYLPSGVKKTALTSVLTSRVNDASFPSVRRLLQTKKKYRKVLDDNAIRALNETIEGSRQTVYSRFHTDEGKYAEHADKEAQGKRNVKTFDDETWSRHVERLKVIAAPRIVKKPSPPKRNVKRLSEMLARLTELSTPSEMKRYKPKSETERDPTKVNPMALKYVISERVNELAKRKPRL